MKQQKKLTAENLKSELWKTLLGVRNRKVEPIVANAIATQSREILRVVKMEYLIAEKMNGDYEKISGFIEHK